MPPTEMKGNPTKEYVSLGRIGYGAPSKKPKFDPSAGRDYDADAMEDPEAAKMQTPGSSRMMRPDKSKKTAATTEASLEPIPVVPVAKTPA
jgi:hypothetical protein